MEGKSNPVWCRENPPYRLYWGELHCHTFHSDGYGSRESQYAFLRDIARLDFAAITDHDVEADTQDSTIDVMWRAAQYTSAKFNDPHRFVTFPAWEWSPHRYAISGDHPLGDHNVYFGQEDPARNLLNAGTERFNTLDKLYRGLDTLGEKAFVIPHVGGNSGQWDTHSDMWQPLAEIYSVHGSFEAYGRLAAGKYGRKVGFIGAADSHNGQGGGFPPSNVVTHHCQGGLTAAYASELTRDALIDAIFQRQVYAVSGPRILVDFTVNGNPMGREIRSTTQPELSVLAHGEEAIWKVDIVKDGRVVHTWTNEEVEDNSVITILWRNWYPDHVFDRVAAGFRGGLAGRVWDGTLTVAGSGIESVFPCSFTLPRDKITAIGQNAVSWTSFTRGDWDGVSVGLDKIDRNTSLAFKSGPKTFALQPGRMKERIAVMPAGDLSEIAIIRGKPANKTVSFEWKDTEEAGEYYYVRVTQIDGEEAWASPVYLTQRGK